MLEPHLKTRIEAPDFNRVGWEGEVDAVRACRSKRSLRRINSTEQFPEKTFGIVKPAPETRSDLTLDAASRVMAPLGEWLLHEGVTHSRLANALKQTFLDAAPDVLEGTATKVNDSSISTLTGVHRKDVREWRSVGKPLPQSGTFEAVTELFTRWANDPDYRESEGRPRVFDRVGGPGSFEALAALVGSDVHAHTLLSELIRLGVADCLDTESDGEGAKVSLSTQALVPRKGAAEMLQLFSDNVAYHLAAATHNLMQPSAPMLEQSVFADSLRPESVAAMNALARQIWLRTSHDIVRDATKLCEQDRGQGDADQRVRVGMYFYHGPNVKQVG